MQRCLAPYVDWKKSWKAWTVDAGIEYDILLMPLYLSKTPDSVFLEVMKFQNSFESSLNCDCILAR